MKIMLALLVAAAPPPVAAVLQGKAAWVAGDYGAALAQLRPAAEAGNAEAQFYLGEAYRLGRAVTADSDQAIVWYRRSAALGETRARDALGLTLFASGKRAEAMPLLEKAADGGDARALYVLGTAHFNGDNTTRDWPLAYAMMMRASSIGLPQAKTSLDVMDRYLFPADKARAQALYATMIAAAPPAPVRPAPIQSVAPAPARPAPVVAKPQITAAPPPAAVRPASPVAVSAKPAAIRPGVAGSAPVSSRVGGVWRVQLGAFGSADRANAAWTDLARKIAPLKQLDHRVVPAGPLQRLQAIGIADRAGANDVCKAVAAAGSACLPVAPDR